MVERKHVIFARNVTTGISGDYFFNQPGTARSFRRERVEQSFSAGDLMTPAVRKLDFVFGDRPDESDINQVHTIGDDLESVGRRCPYQR